MTKQEKVSALYKKLLDIYPRAFREQLGESMEQTFLDLCNEQKGQAANGFFILSLFADIAVGIVREHFLLFREGNIMKNMLASPTSAAIISFLLVLPIGFLRLALGSDIEPLVRSIESVLTIDGSQPHALGLIIICGGMLLLPVAFLLNLYPMLQIEKPEGKRRLYAINITVGVIILLLILSTWGGLIVEEIYCLRGIRCD